jgi:hypothetical protein
MSGACEPVRKSLLAPRPVDAVFAAFADRIGSWWPLREHSIGGPQAVHCAIEGHVGGEVYEVNRDGYRVPWGHVLAWQPPSRVVLSWHPGRPPSTAQELEISFLAWGQATRVDLVHREWARLGEKAEEARESYLLGWDLVFLDCFARAVGAVAAR